MKKIQRDGAVIEKIFIGYSLEKGISVTTVQILF